MSLSCLVVLDAWVLVLRRRTRIRRETTPHSVSCGWANLGLCSNIGGLPVTDVGNLVIDMFALLEFINVSIKLASAVS